MLTNAMNLTVFVFHLSFCPRCTCVVQTGIWASAIHATACANPGQRDEDERSYEHKTTSLLTLFTCSFSDGVKHCCFFNNVLYEAQEMVSHTLSVWSTIIFLPLGLRWVSLWAVRWCLWRSVLKAGKLLAQAGCPHRSSPCPVEMPRPGTVVGFTACSGHSFVFPLLFVLLQILSC